MKAIKSKVLPDSRPRLYRQLRQLQCPGRLEVKHRRVNHSKTFVGLGGHHINGIENFWNQAKRVLRKYNGIPRKNFHLFLKECEFRFNYSSPKQQFAQIKKWANL